MAAVKEGRPGCIRGRSMELRLISGLNVPLANTILLSYADGVYIPPRGPVPPHPVYGPNGFTGPRA
jgi:hypothetical protein